MSFPFGVATTWVQRVKQVDGSGKPVLDSMGNQVVVPTRTAVQAQAFDPGTSVELVQGQDVVTTQPTVYYPPGTVPVAVDAIEIGSVSYEVDGTPLVPTSPFTAWQPGVVVRLRRVTG